MPFLNSSAPLLYETAVLLIEEMPQFQDNALKLMIKWSLGLTKFPLFCRHAFANFVPIKGPMGTLHQF